MSQLARALGLLALLPGCLLLGGCAGPRRRRPSSPPPPRAERPAPPPGRAYDPQASPGVVLSLDELGRARLDGQDVSYLTTALDDLRRAQGRRVALQLEAPSALPWRDVAPAYEACAQVGLSNLHWKVAGDERPALRLPRFPARDELRSGRVVISVADGQARHRWEPTLPRRDGERVDRPLTTTELLVFVREARARRVEVWIEPQVPYGLAWGTLEALRDTGTVVAVRVGR